MMSQPIGYPVIEMRSDLSQVSGSESLRNLIAGGSLNQILIKAAYIGDIKSVTLALDNGASVTAVEEVIVGKREGPFMALQAAAAGGHTAIVQLLLDRSAAVEGYINFHTYYNKSIMAHPCSLQLALEGE